MFAEQIRNQSLTDLEVGSVRSPAIEVPRCLHLANDFLMYGLRIPPNHPSSYTWCQPDDGARETDEMFLITGLPKSPPTHHLSHLHLQRRRQLDDMMKGTGTMVQGL